MSGVINPFAPENNTYTPEYPEVTFRGRRSLTMEKEELPPSETDSLLGNRRTPPPRYSSIEGFPQHPTTVVSDGAIASVHIASVNQPTPNTQHFPPQQPNQHVNQPTPNTQHFPPQQPNQHVNVVNPQAGLQTGWNPWLPGVVPGMYFPPGLEHLNGLDQVTITGRAKCFRIWRDESHQIFTARISYHGRCGSSKDASIRVVNNANLEVLSLNRTRESEGCCSRSNEHVEVCFNTGAIVGVVQGYKAEYTIHNPSGDVLFIIERQRGRCCRRGGYEVVSCDRYPMGYITKDRSRCGGTRAVRVAFPQEMDLRSKALLLSAALSFRDLHRV